MSQNTVTPDMILDPGFELTLRPMKYPMLYDMYKSALKNTWTVEEVNFSKDIIDLKMKMTPAEKHVIQRLVAFFATGDTIVSNNLVLTLYRHINSPEGRMYLSRQLQEEALHIQFYLTLLDEYIPDHNERKKAFAAIENIPTIRRKAEFCNKWTDYCYNLQSLNTKEDRKAFLMTLMAFACGVEGLFFFGAFAYVYYFRSRGLLNGLASGTNWVFRDESCHIDFALKIVNIVREQEPDLFDDEMKQNVYNMIDEAIQCEVQFAEDVLNSENGGISGLSVKDMTEYLHYIGDQRLAQLGLPKKYNAKQPFDFMALQDVQELTNFFERKPSAYQTNVEGEVSFNEDF
jgi:ribonucleoside-diphosphate reductase beta chain